VIGLALIAQLAIVAHAPDTVSACDAVEVTVAVSAPGSTSPRIVLPPFAPFEVLRSTVTPHVQLDPRNGGSIVAEYRYVLTTDQGGAFTIPPFEARLSGAVVRSRPLRVVVRGPRTGRGVPTVVARARIDTSLDVNFRALTEPETVFVGQQANYEVAVFLNETVRDRLRRNPTFYPPDMQAMLAYDLPAVTGDLPKRKVGPRCFDALVYQRALFPLVPGRVVIAPAQLVYALPLSASFFSREESHELLTDSTIVVAIEPPLRGRPPEFSGAVGDLAIAARLDSYRGRVGDPMLLTVRVSGTGNVKLFPPPKIEVPWAALVKADERVQVDSLARRIRGAKEFDWVLTPRIAGELDLPPIRYGYFNPDTRRYELASSNGARVSVAAGTLASADTARAVALLSLRTQYRGPLAPPPHQRGYFWVLLAVAPLPALAGRLRGGRRRVAPRPAAAALRALARKQPLACDARHLRRTFTTALAERLGLNAETFTRPDALARALRRAGVSADVATDAERFLRQLDEAAYSSGGLLPADAALRAQALFRAADTEALARPELRLPRMFVLVVVAALPIVTGTLAASSTDDARRDFARGVTAYRTHHYAVAAAAFRSAAHSEPWAADAWANLGTAAWAAADTASAVVGWQRALRLEPGAFDARDRLDLVQSSTFGTNGFVPPVSSTAVLWTALVLWWIAWVLSVPLAFARLTHPATLRRWAYAAGTVSVFLLLTALDLDQRLAARGLGVVRSTARLRSDPALGGEASGTAVIGEVARITRRQGAWTHVSLDGDREGWIESSNFASLERGVGME
jgi:BatD DUF11 like domain